MLCEPLQTPVRSPAVSSEHPNNRLYKQKQPSHCVKAVVVPHRGFEPLISTVRVSCPGPARRMWHKQDVFVLSKSGAKVVTFFYSIMFFLTKIFIIVVSVLIFIKNNALYFFAIYCQMVSFFDDFKR